MKIVGPKKKELILMCANFKEKNKKFVHSELPQIATLQKKCSLVF